jgi:hypothetical protein
MMAIWQISRGKWERAWRDSNSRPAASRRTVQAGSLLPNSIKFCRLPCGNPSRSDAQPVSSCATPGREGTISRERYFC